MRTGLRVERQAYQSLAHGAARGCKRDGGGRDRVTVAALEAYACPKETDSKEGVLGKPGMGGGRRRSLEWAPRGDRQAAAAGRGGRQAGSQKGLGPDAAEPGVLMVGV